MATPNNVKDADQLLNFSEQIGTQPAETNSIKRALDILFRSQATWSIVAEERGGLKEVFVPYSIIIGLIPMLIGSAISSTLLGAYMALMGNPGGVTSLPGHLFSTVLAFLYGVVGTLVLGKIVEVVSPNFGLRKSWVLSTRVLVYASTPASLAVLLSWIPLLGSVISMTATIWSIILALRGFKIVLAPLPPKTVEPSTSTNQTKTADERELAGV